MTIYIIKIAGHTQQSVLFSKEKAKQYVDEFSRGNDWEIIEFEEKGVVESYKQPPLYKILF